MKKKHLKTKDKENSQARIRRSGDLLHMDTNPTVPKALGVIQVKELKGELTAQDKKAFNWLLHNAFDEISENVVHEAKGRFHREVQQV